MTDTKAANDATTNEPGDIVLDVQNLVVEFKSGRQRVQAVSGVSFQVRRGETLGLVGESGCGKSTTGRTLVQVQPATSGSINYLGQDLNGLKGRKLRRIRTKIQMIFQDPISSLNPRRRIKDIVAEPLVIWKRGTKDERAVKVRAMLEAVGIDPDSASDRTPGEFSGGQCQRISIARALMAEPDLLICDEPVSALDVSVQAQILNLLADLKAQFGLTMVFIVVSFISGYFSGVLLGASTGHPRLFIQSVFQAVAKADVLNVLVKTVVSGAMTGVICCTEGLSVGAAATEVPQAASRAVVRSVAALFVISALVSLLTYL